MCTGRQTSHCGGRKQVKARTTVRFGAFADAHYAEKTYGDRCCGDSAAKLSACAEKFRHADLDFAVCMGDLIDSAGTRQEEVDYARIMAGRFAAFTGARHFVLGNHDLSALSKAEFLGLCGAAHPPWYSFDVQGIHFVVLDGNHHADGSDFETGNFSWDQAWLSAPQIDWLAGDLEAVPDRPTLVLCHENIDHRLSQGGLDPHVVRDAAQARSVLESTGRVTAVLQAHYHPGLATVQNGIAYISLRAMVVGPGLENNAYAVIGVDQDGRVEVEGYGQQRSLRDPVSRYLNS